VDAPITVLFAIPRQHEKQFLINISMNESQDRKDIPIRFGFPDTLPPLGGRELRSCFVFAAMGLLVLMLGLFPSLRPPTRAAVLLPICYLVLAGWGLFRFLKRKRCTAVAKPEKRTTGTSTQVGIFTVIMVAVGFGFFFWARHLGVAVPVIFGSLLLIEGLGAAIVSLTEWWRLSHIGLSLGLMAGGFLLPLVPKTLVAVPVGGAFLLGSLVSAAILHWQVRHHEASSTNRIA
jgi:hypothetical protein